MGSGRLLRDPYAAVHSAGLNGQGTFELGPGLLLC